MINRDRLGSTFLELVQIDSPSGQEDEIARHLVAELSDLGLQVARDETGNVIGRLAGGVAHGRVGAHGRVTDAQIEEDGRWHDGHLSHQGVVADPPFL